MMRNPGHTVTIYDVGGLIGQAFENSTDPFTIRDDDLEISNEVTIHEKETRNTMKKPGCRYYKPIYNRSSPRIN